VVIVRTTSFRLSSDHKRRHKVAVLPGDDAQRRVESRRRDDVLISDRVPRYNSAK
jgi:hypothetical protein